MATNEPSRHPNIVTLAYDDECVDPVVELLGVAKIPAAFKMPGTNVWQLTLPGRDGRASILVTMWTGKRVRRVDVITGPTTIVFTDIATVDLVPGVEVQFRTTRRSMLVVARQGNVIVRAT